MRDGTMGDELTPRQQLLLWSLVSRGGSALRKDLRPEVVAADRTALERRGFVSASKERNAVRLTVEDRGWEHLATVAPTLLASGKGSTFDRPILQFVLERVQAFAAAAGVPLARVFVPGADEAVDGGADAGEARVDGEASGRTTRADAPRGAGPEGRGRDGAGLEDRIATAFFEIAGRLPTGPVRLRALRTRLGDAPRDDVDRALAAMGAAKRISLSTLSSPADVAREGDAPLVVDGRTFHTIWIDP